MQSSPGDGNPAIEAVPVDAGLGYHCQDHEGVAQPCVDAAPSAPTSPGPQLPEATDSLHSALVRKWELFAKRRKLLDRPCKRLPILWLETPAVGERRRVEGNGMW